MLTARNVPGFIVVEPDQARDHVINMIRRGVQFCCEIDPNISGMKDCVVLSRSAVLESTPGWTPIRQLATCMDDACHYALRCIREELTFQCTPKPREHDGEFEYFFQVQMRSDGRRA